MILDINSLKYLQLSNGEIKENIYLNFMLDNNNLPFEIYENGPKININNNDLSNLIILKKEHKYDFKYYPYNNELIINFLDFPSNKIFNKTFYAFDSHNFFINYNIMDTINNNIVSLFFDINGKIKIDGYFSNDIIFDNTLEDYEISTEEKYINIKKNVNFYYLNINIHIYSIYKNNFKIHEINEIITNNQINSKYNLLQNKNILFFIDNEIKEKYFIFESFILLSINSPKNTIKLINYKLLIIKSHNFLISKLFEINGIFISVEEDIFFSIRLVPEKISKNINNNIPTIYSNIINQNKEYIIEYIHETDYKLLFYNKINEVENNLEIYYLNNINSILDD